MKIKANLRYLSLYTCFVWLFVLMWVRDNLATYVVAIFSRIPLLGDYSQWLYPVCAVFLGVVSISIWSKKITPKDLLKFIVFVFIYLLSIIWLKGNGTTLAKNVINVFCICIPMYIAGLSIDFEDCILEGTESRTNVGPTLIKLSRFIIVISAMYLVYKVNIKTTGRYEEGSIGYTIAVNIAILLIYAMPGKRIIDYLICLIGFVAILACGNRGTIVCLLAFILLYFFLNQKLSRAVYMFIGILTLLIILAYQGYLDILIQWLRMVVAEKLGLSTRIFDFLDTSEPWESDEDRLRIIRLCFQAIQNRPILGYGLFGDITLINSYAHNLFLELAVQFGVFGGTIIVADIAFIWIRGLRSTVRGSYQRAFILALTSMTLVQFMFSGSLWTSPLFYLLLGYCERMSRNRPRCVGRSMK